MRIEKINQLYRVKHDVAKTKIQSILDKKHLTDDDSIFVQVIIHCDDNRVSYNVMVKNESFTIFDDGTELG